MKREPTLKESLRADDDMPAMDLSPIHSMFKEGELPHIDETPVGRLRLLKALSRKFGQNYRSYPGVNEALSHYDNEAKMMGVMKRIKELKNG